MTSWLNKPGLSIYNTNLKQVQSRCVIFDLDGTIIKHRIGYSLQNWTYLFTKTKHWIHDLYSSGYDIYILSNQAYADPKLLGIIEKILIDIDVPLQAYIAISIDKYGKPRPFIWTEFINKFNQYNPKDCYFIGDSNGSPKWRASSRADLYFAVNNEINYHDPDLSNGLKDQTFEYYKPNDKFRCGTIKDFNFPKTQHMILFVGSPASGKTYYALNHLSNYLRISQDDLKTLAKCKKFAKSALLIENHKNNVLIDATNSKLDTRAEWIAIANELNIPIYCIYFDFKLGLTKHLNAYRLITTGRYIPTIAMNIYFRNVVPPTVDEGFKKIYTIKKFVIEGLCNPIMNKHLADSQI